MVDFTYTYFRNLKKFGITDDSVENGYLALCNAYAKKTHTQIMPIIINILKSVLPFHKKFRKKKACK